MGKIGFVLKDEEVTEEDGSDSFKKASDTQTKNAQSEIQALTEETESFFRHFELVSMFGFIGILFYLMWSNSNNYSTFPKTSSLKDTGDKDDERENLLQNRSRNSGQNSTAEKTKLFSIDNKLTETLLVNDTEYYEII